MLRNSAVMQVQFPCPISNVPAPRLCAEVIVALSLRPVSIHENLFQFAIATSPLAAYIESTLLLPPGARIQSTSAKGADYVD